MITIIDYGIGNIFSIRSSLEYIGVESKVTSDFKQILNAQRILLPGVGAFGDASKKLKITGLDKIIKQYAKTGKPMLGICLGMQLLFEKSYEYGEHEGLGLLPGEVIRFSQTQMGENARIPHVGWNQIHINKENSIIKSVSDGSHVYYVHSYYVPINESTVASTRYENTEFSAVVNRDNVYGTQFHPEKSGEVGLDILRNFSRI